MNTLPTDLRNKLERTCIAARNLAERAAADALKSLAVAHHEPYGHMTPVQRSLRNKLWARAKQLGDTADAKGLRSIGHLAQECAYEHWHRMLFARFLAENNLLIEPDMGVAVSLDEVKELAKSGATVPVAGAGSSKPEACSTLNLWTLAGRYAQTMLPEIFRADDPVLQVALAREDQIKLEELLDALAKDTFTASDALGWCYQFWQAEKKETVNKSGNKIGADELPSVTQLFTEDYMVDFLLDNTLGAWWAGKQLRIADCGLRIENEEQARKAVALPGCPWKYLRFVKVGDTSNSRSSRGNEAHSNSVKSQSLLTSAATGNSWQPAAGRFDGWPKTAKELKALDPCCGSGHFIVAMFQRLVALRLAEEKLDEKAAVAAVIRDNLFGLELDPRCTQIGAFNLALAAWRRVGHCALPAMHIACSGLAPNAREADWLKLAGDSDKLQRGMARLYRLFQNAPVLGSLINPHAGGGDLLEAGFQELRPLLAKALEAEKFRLREGADDTAHEMAVTAQGITKAAEILAGQFTLVATNVPYLGARKQNESLQEYCERIYPDAKHDLATCFVERCVDFCAPGSTTALVTPQNWLFLGTYSDLRARMLETMRWEIIAKLGAKAFQTPMWDFNIALLSLTRSRPTPQHQFLGSDVSDYASPDKKAMALSEKAIQFTSQHDQLKNPDARLSFGEQSDSALLEVIADAPQGAKTGDDGLWRRCFWELPSITGGWLPYQSTVEKSLNYGGRADVIDWRTEGIGMIRPRVDNRAVTKAGVAVSQIGLLSCTIYTGERFDSNVAAIVPKKPAHLIPLWTFCSSPEFYTAVRRIDQKLNVTNATFLKIPFDLAHWQKVAAEKYPHGLPKPFSSDPTQWLFNGYPNALINCPKDAAGNFSLQPSAFSLQVAVARLLGYQWPRQTGSSFPDCPALGPDGLEKLADDDGIVCLPSVRGESPAAERLRKLLSVAYGKDWKSTTELELIRATGSEAGDLEEWLRDDFFDQHCDLFHQRPFVWHIWDGRKRDGFHALVNYHTLASGDQGRRTLESLTHSYLGDWITRQKDGMKREEEGADERLAAALALKEKLEAILVGEGDPARGTGFDIFVRWKPLSQQAIGWQPDINDGVRMNIRPFLASDIAGGKKGAGVLRIKPNIKWDKDRGKEPKRDKKDFPWFWNGSTFTGDRVNDVHLTRKQKEEGASRTGK